MFEILAINIQVQNFFPAEEVRIAPDPFAVMFT